MLNARSFFTVRGPLRHGNGSFHFKVAVHETASLSGQAPSWLGSCEVDADDVQAVLLLAEALRLVADQLPPPLVLPENGERN